MDDVIILSMKENYYQFNKAYSFLRHSSLLPNRKTLLFLSGIGDSSLSYLPFLTSDILKQFNIIIPDMLGCGKSSENDEYSLDTQVEVVIQHIAFLESEIKFPLNDIIIVAHSIGSIRAMKLCDSSLKAKIKGVVLIEGSITQYGSFICETVFSISQRGNFDEWFKAFKEETIFNDFIKKFPACRPYYASLSFCQPSAFLQNALETHRVSTAGTGKYTNLAGQQFLELSLPKIYCYGDKSLCKESVDFLHEYHIPTKVFSTDNHFVMLECFSEFEAFLNDWMR